MNENVNTTTLPEQDLSTLSKICMNMEQLEEHASRCDSLVDIFAEALESMHEKGIQPVDGATYGNVAEVIRQYSLAVKNSTEDIHDKLSALKNTLKDGECHE